MQAKRLIFLYFLLFLSFITLAQNEIDQLKNELVDSQGDKKAQLLCDLCKKYWVVNIDSARMYCEQAELQATGSENIELLFFISLNTGTVNLYASDYPKALHYYEKAYTLAIDNDYHLGAHKAMNNLGLVYQNIGNYSKAIDYYSESLAIKKKLNDLYGVGNTLNNIGSIYFRLGDFNRALEYFEEALTYNLKVTETRMRTNSYVHLASVHFELNNYQESEKNYNLAIAESVGPNNVNGMATAFSGLGQLKLANQEYDSAEIYFTKAITLNRQLGNKKEIIRNLLQMSELRAANEDYDNAERYLGQGMSLAIEIDQKELLLSCYEHFSRLYEGRKQYEQAFNYSEKYRNLKDQINSLGLVNNLIDISLAQQELKNQEELISKEKQLAFSKVIIVLVSLVASIAVLFVYIIFNKMKFKQHVNRLLEEKVRDRTRELHHRNKALKASNAELDNFVYKTSHDLRGPVARFQGMINLIDKDNSEKQSYLKLLNHELNQMYHVLERLTLIHDLSLHELNVEEISLFDEVQSVIDESSQKIEGLDFTNDVPKGLIWNVDRYLLRIVISSLIDNAEINKKGESDHVKIKATKTGKFIRFFVSDNGVGIPEDSLHRIFDMFYQASAKNTGTGLTLYTAKKATERFGGHIEVLNPKMDTIFAFSIPNDSA